MQFIDLNSQRERLRDRIEPAVAKVLESGQYIMGPEVQAFEAELAEFGGADHALGCANGTDALVIALMALGVGPGDAVFCPSFSFCATAEAVALIGAIPVFVDIDRRTYNLCPESLATAAAEAGERGWHPKAIIAVDLFGQSADYLALRVIADAHGLAIISDSAQGFGTTLDGKPPLEWAEIQTTSFYPAKPLGAYGDGGAVLTNNEGLRAAMNSIRVHGQGTDRYDNVRIGLNSRLDTIQAAILQAKLSIFADELKTRQRVAERYSNRLHNAVETPFVMDSVRSTWAQYTIALPDPEGLAAALREQGIPTARYYPRPIHVQGAYTDYPVVSTGLPNTMARKDEVISLPMHPYLSEADQERVIAAVVEFAA